MKAGDILLLQQFNNSDENLETLNIDYQKGSKINFTDGKHMTDNVYRAKGERKHTHPHIYTRAHNRLLSSCSDLNEAELSPAERASHRGQGC